MEFYDVIIVGAGIAGCGLSYNLKKIGYKGKVLVIDKNKIGANGTIHRNTFEDIIQEYKLDYVHKYKGLKICSYEEELLTLNKDFYLIDYEKTCEELFERSDFIFRNEEALKVKNNFLKTDKNIYKFNYLVDCSGANFYFKKILNKPLPIKYWIGNIGLSKNNIKFPDDYCYYSFNEEGFLEDFYPLKNLIMQGSWRYTNKIDFNLLLKNTGRPKAVPGIPLAKTKKVVIPCSPSFPIIYKNIALLGDSFGNATPSTGEGIAPILKSSEFLAEALMKKNLKLYDKKWKKKYLQLYLRHLALRMNFKGRIMMIKLLRNHKEIFFKLLRNQKVTLPKQLRKQIPNKVIAKNIYYFFKIKIKYILKKL